jgi:predicted PurR-regulated permease PerM
MIDELKKEFTSFKLLVVLLIIAVSIYLAQILWQFLGNFSDIIIMLLIAWLLSFILEPLVKGIEKLAKLPKIVAGILVYAFFASIFTILIVLVVPIIITEFQALALVIPKYLAPYPSYLKIWNNALTNSVDTLVSIIPSVATFVFDAFLVLVLSFYLIIDKERINDELYKLSPKTWQANLKFIQTVIDESFASFLQIQVIFGIFAGITTWIVLRIFSVDFAASVALIAGIITIIPLLGPVIGLFPPVFVALITNPNNPTEAIIIFAILLVVQQIAFNSIGPKLMGKAFSLHPIVVFISIILGFKIAGPLGAVFVVPFLGIIVIVLRELGHYFINPQETSNKK